MEVYEMAMYATLGLVIWGLYQDFVYKRKTTTERRADLGEQANVTVDLPECSGCTVNYSFMKGKDRGLFHIRLPDGRLVAKEYHNSDLEVRPIDVMNGIIHVREKGVVPALEVFDSEFEAADAEQAVKKRVMAPARDVKFEESQKSYYDGVKEYAEKFVEEKVQPPTSERIEEAVDRVLVNGSVHDEEPEPAPPKAPLRAVKDKFFYEGKTRISRAEYEKRIAEEKEARK